MGTFGLGPFDNDAALDLVCELVESDKNSLLKSAFAKAIRTKSGQLEDWQSQEAVAMAAIVANLRGNPTEKPSVHIREWTVTTRFTPDDSLTKSAITALRRVVNDSELADLMSKGKDFKRWARKIDQLIEHLEKPAVPIKKKPTIVLPIDQRKAIATLKKHGFYFAGPPGRPHFCTGRGRQLPDYAAECFRLLPTIRELHIEYRISPNGWKNLIELQKLQNLNISDAKGVDAGAEMFRDMRQLIELNATKSDFGDKAFVAIGNASRLKHLDLSRTKISDAGSIGISGLRELETLRLYDTSISDDTFAAIASLEKLKTLNVGLTNVTFSGVKKLKSLQNLEGIFLDGSKVDDSSATCLAEFPSLRKLSVGETSFGDIGCRSLAKSKTITALRLHGTAVTSKGCKYLSKIKSLRELYLEATAVDDIVCKDLATLSSLRVLHVDKSPITLAGLAHLSDLKNLIEISFDRSEVQEGDCHILQQFSKNVRFNVQNGKISKACKKLFEQNKFRIWGESLSGGLYIESTSAKCTLRPFGLN